MSDLQVYDDLAQRRNAAYVAFKAMYELQNPPPSEPPPAQLSRVDVIVIGALLVGSAIVSASRTIAEYSNGKLDLGYLLVGFAGFVMLEMAGVAYAYYRTKLNYNSARHESVLKWVERGLALALVTAILANLHQSLKQHGIDIGLLNVINAALSGYAPPVLAFIAGDVLGSMAVKMMQDQKQARTKYDGEVTVWREGLNRAFAAYAPKLNAQIRIEPSAIPDLSNGISNGIPLETGTAEASKSLPSESTLGHRKQPNARSLAEEWFDQYLGDLNAIDAKAICTELGIGKSTFYAVLSERKARAVGNGGE